MGIFIGLAGVRLREEANTTDTTVCILFIFEAAAVTFFGSDSFRRLISTVWFCPLGMLLSDATNLPRFNKSFFKKTMKDCMSYKVFILKKLIASFLLISF